MKHKKNDNAEKMYSSFNFRVEHPASIHDGDAKTRRYVKAQLSLDMVDVSQIISIKKRMKVLVRYFNERPLCLPKNGSAVQNAFKMCVLASISTAQSEVTQMANCELDDIFLNASWSKDTDELEIQTGIHKKLGRKKAKVISDLLNIAITHHLLKFNKLSRKYDTPIANYLERVKDKKHPLIEKMESQSPSDDVEYDEETKAMLSMLEWDKTIKGQA